MCKGERPIGAAKGKQINTMASSPPPPQWLCTWAGTIRHTISQAPPVDCDITMGHLGGLVGGG